jgi:hypothetical protein
MLDRLAMVERRIIVTFWPYQSSHDRDWAKEFDFLCASRGLDQVSTLFLFA